jgi:nicotinamidase-related amidase
MSSLALVVIDGQNDFCADGSEPDGKRGSLCVEGAGREAGTVADLILRLGSNISSITATLDSHQRNDCSIHMTWKDKQGGTPPTFTIINHDDIKEDRYVPLWESVPWIDKSISSKEWALFYTKALKDNNRPQLCLWPVHCQIGTWGNNVYPVLHNAYDTWCKKTTKFINYVVKGEFPYAECYSAFGPDVSLANSLEPRFNKQLYLHLLNHDKILWTGWAGSHCLRYSALDAIRHSQACNDLSFVNKCIFFEDACASVTDIPGASYKFTDWRRNFLNEVANLGATITNTRDFKPNL